MSRAPTPAQREAIRQAAHWYVRLASATDDGEEHAQWQHWHDSDPLHRQAWQRMQVASASFGGLPQRLAASTLLGAGHSRRQVLYGLALLLGGGTFAALGWRSDLRREWSADERSAIGERREVRLADGSRLLLDTDSAVDVRFDARQRQLRLHRGRILIDTASDPAARPFSVVTHSGQVLALGTRFTVAVDEQGAEVAVLEKAVEVSLDPTRRLRLEAGQRARFGAAGIGPVRASDASVAAWQDGSLIAIDLPLGELLAQLSRYRPGLLTCDPAVAGMRISGAFPIDDTELALTALQASFPVAVRRRTRYWVTVTGRT
ncbi:FecR domain-containing protein [Pseudomonas japonica]|uniref:FecR family protein n=1 Tax=Pseudomonas japonica TaxID=256466 RepID=A0A239L4U0_9PSED|nr:FecR domain-containing protein [Pseudomonas japonica]SNT24709.1 FecR family protein [Pseudomonas japonica]